MNNIDVPALVKKLQDSGFGWISKIDLERMIDMIMVEIKSKPPELKND